MKIQIYNHDVPNLIGKFIIQLVDKKEEESPMKLSDDNWNFYKEKRIFFVCRNHDTIDKGVNETINTIIEEFIHLKYQVYDETRAFQTAMITEMICYMKKINSYVV